MRIVLGSNLLAKSCAVTNVVAEVFINKDLFHVIVLSDGVRAACFVNKVVGPVACATVWGMLVW